VIPDAAVVAAACASSVHTPQVPATVRGTWLEALSGHRIAGVWYCEKCALAAEGYQLFTLDEGQTK
jgi:hypothetical protein